MWRKQIRAERAAEEGSVLVAKAKKLSDAAMERPGSPLSEDVSETEGETRAPSISSDDSDVDATTNNIEIATDDIEITQESSDKTSNLAHPHSS